jgi:hypothetical protein
MNYRSAVVFGTGLAVTDEAEKLAALRAISEQALPGRWADVRGPTAKELAVTSVIKIALEEASAKIRSGPPVDDEADYQLPIWAGVLPLETRALTPEPDARLASDVALPEYLQNGRRLSASKT